MKGCESLTYGVMVQELDAKHYTTAFGFQGLVCLLDRLTMGPSWE